MDKLFTNQHINYSFEMNNIEKRINTLDKVNRYMEHVLNILSLFWIGLIIYEFIYGLNNILEIVFYVLWAIFVIDFIVEIIP